MDLEEVRRMSLHEPGLRPPLSAVQEGGLIMIRSSTLMGQAAQAPDAPLRARRTTGVVGRVATAMSTSARGVGFESLTSSELPWAVPDGPT